MKKTVTANIGGIVFHIDEDAYEKLGSYLSHIKTHFSTDAGRDEILSDIENRIAEMFEQKISASKKVITLEDVNEIISQLGEPEQMADPEEPANQKRKREQEEKTQKRLYRDPDDKYIAGVAGGLGAFFNLDPTWIRVAFVVFTFMYGFGPLLYIILWIVVPRARTTAERLEMRGEKVNISNIEKSIREELNDLKDNIKEFTDETKEHLKKKEKDKYSRERNSKLADNFARIFLKAAGIILIFLSFSFLMAIISGIYIIPVSLQLSHGFMHFSVPEVLAALLPAGPWIQFTMIALLLIVGIPLFWMLLTGIQLLFDIKTNSKFLGMATFIIWLAAVATLSIGIVKGLGNFTDHSAVSEEYVLETGTWPNLYLDINETRLIQPASMHRNYMRHSWKHLWRQSAHEATGIPELRIRTNTTDETSLTIIREARGSSPYWANTNATGINYNFQQRDSLLILDPVFHYEKDSGWRNQKVRLELDIPEEKVVVLRKRFREYLPTHYGRSVNVAAQ